MSEKVISKFGYSMPWNAPFYGGPPYEYYDSWIMMIGFTSTPEAATALVPQPLIPNPDNALAFWFNRFKVKGGLGYQEVIVSVPCNYDSMYGHYSAYLYLDRFTPIVVGREVYGFPKMDATITSKEDSLISTVTVARRDTVIAEAKMTVEETADAADFQSTHPWFSLKLIPSVDHNRPPDVMQLTATTLTDWNVKAVKTGAAELEFGTSPANPLSEIPIVEVHRGILMNVSGILGYGNVLHDYLDKSP